MTKLPKGLKIGDLIEVIGTDWTTDSSWLHYDTAINVSLPVIKQPGYFVGVRDGCLIWSALKIIWWDPETEDDVKYTHIMKLSAINKIRRLKR